MKNISTETRIALTRPRLVAAFLATVGMAPVGQIPHADGIVRCWGDNGLDLGILLGAWG
jgi:hypothetical protein